MVGRPGQQCLPANISSELRDPDCMEEPGKSTDRNHALDFTKGALILFMILYHWINYFVGIGGPVFTYLRVIPPSFIFITGFLIVNLYPTKYGFSGPKAYERLIFRGLKLLVLFTVLNLIANAFFVRSYSRAMPGVDGFLRDAATIYISGNIKAVFGILIPISYLLLLSTGIFLVGQVYKHSIPLVCAALFFLIAFLELHGLSTSHLTLIGIGLLGLVAGFFPTERIDAWVDHPSVIVCLNIGYIFAISIWEISYLPQAIGVCLSVILIYLTGMKTADWGGIRSTIILLGKYSLFGYIAQIGLLQLLHRGLPYLNLDKWELWVISFVGAFALTIMIVKVVHNFRAKSRSVDWLYRVVFT